ncbi:hypothetical protein WICANDRAFT_55030 [Wickerhamomyces anomalus NRRL Y-366-8]|uniref:Uncharacterized protein n=1 Tax=Wickerhamomyces anomalus (strain ATCC 58044 / CBS 1984 / NCYC 433 / NRRL Y-366-8) TaxID=683960 RepID=A0A1E3P0E1_WICAA|nr:uncharacterized protein WICANDRAFT_55030 [Wickerhamomyces anomalus NRRL Y-366-8]ODQ58835.1 hypothetical protein WICANDRAFT_55030 [Wickerhamomyces anomalus NRRL Y-366-8]
MSTKEAAKVLVKLLEQVPKEKLTSLSLKEVQLNRYRPVAEEFTESDILQQIQALKSISSNQYRDYYYPGDKLIRPQGNPDYYERLLAEISGEGKENLFTGLRTVVLGK